MKPAPFAWHAPETLEEALALKSMYGDEARFLAGGQSLVPAMNFRVAQPRVLIDLNRLNGLGGIAASPDGALTIGAMARNARIERDAMAARHHLSWRKPWPRSRIPKSATGVRWAATWRMPIRLLKCPR